ncbi:endoplasmic reticulum vesicle transporter protein [Actinidia rufa]|uniref:Endoplasmic reticulum vesicle transporter protein n=1 Tax=Actinidia rufa TaxID=165716 RepID=A0A7J0EUH4_9ERIC|nr:endoplasmic reticulum vesicle transporter protein [Actinidia rufa]
MVEEAKGGDGCGISSRGMVVKMDGGSSRRGWWYCGVGMVEEAKGGDDSGGGMMEEAKGGDGCGIGSRGMLVKMDGGCSHGGWWYCGVGMVEEAKGGNDSGGGIFTVAGIVDSFVYLGRRAIKKKAEINGELMNSRNEVAKAQKNQAEPDPIPGGILMDTRQVPELHSYLKVSVGTIKINIGIYEYGGLRANPRAPDGDLQHPVAGTLLRQYLQVEDLRPPLLTGRRLKGGQRFEGEHAVGGEGVISDEDDGGGEEDIGGFEVAVGEWRVDVEIFEGLSYTTTESRSLHRKGIRSLIPRPRV